MSALLKKQSTLQQQHQLQSVMEMQFLRQRRQSLCYCIHHYCFCCNTLIENELIRLMGLQSIYSSTFYKWNPKVPHIIIFEQANVAALRKIFMNFSSRLWQSRQKCNHYEVDQTNY
ncbi:unnamed protein product [Paramecium pentaurelia]|uniref:Uncharacterized protein n=1 Tax=Paramecium pentaurelia TaxID=43138 RepID=A0A8S1URW3_9CILI|nr:unnamed protein product [Paramecium pentaurelia]